MNEEKRKLFEKCLVRVNKIRAGAQYGSITAADVQNGFYEVFEEIYSEAFDDGYCCGGNNAS